MCKWVLTLYLFLWRIYSWVRNGYFMGFMALLLLKIGVTFEKSLEKSHVHGWDLGWLGGIIMLSDSFMRNPLLMVGLGV